MGVKCLLPLTDSQVYLVRTTRESPEYRHFRDRHYVPNHGCIGRQIHYLIVEGNTPIGIITGASPVWACKPRDRFFGINKDNRIEMLDRIINNAVFRLEKNTKNLASHILAVWRRQIVKDWKETYGIDVIGFETFVYGRNRHGTVYKADNWTFCGITAGNAKRSPRGIYSGTTREKTERKLVFCRYV